MNFWLPKLETSVSVSYDLPRHPRLMKKDQLEKAFQDLSKTLGLYPFSFTFEFHKKDDWHGLAIERLFPYRDAHVDVYPRFFTWTREDQRNTIIHELLHLILWELTLHRTCDDDRFEEIEENTVDQLSMSIAPFLDSLFPKA